MPKKSDKKEEEMHSSLRILAKTSFIVLIGLFISKLFTYIYRIIVARFFGPEVYGIFSLAAMILALFVAISSLGLIDGILRYVSLYRAKKENEKIKYILRFSLITLLISGIASGVILFLLSESLSLSVFHNPAMQIYLKTFSFLIPIFILANAFLHILRAYEKVNYYSFLQNILQNILKVIFLLAFIFVGLNSNSSVIFSFFIAIFIMMLFAYILSRQLIPNIFEKVVLTKKQKSEIKKDLFNYSWPLIFLGVIGNLYYWTDSFLLGYFKSAIEVGIYNAAVPIAALLLASQEIFMQLFYPLITKEYSIKNFRLIGELSKQVSKWMFIINLPLFLIMLIFPGVLINFLFGKEYLLASNALRILSLGVFISSISGISIAILNTAGKSKLMLTNIAFFSILNVILNILLIPNYGLNGAAIATTISVILSGLVFIFWAYKYFSIIPLRRKMLGIVFISLITFTPLLILKKIITITFVNLAFIGIIFLIIYLALIYITGCFDKNDMAIMNSIKEKIIKK